MNLELRCLWGNLVTIEFFGPSIGLDRETLWYDDPDVREQDGDTSRPDLGFSLGF